MKARTFILTVGAALAIVAPPAHASTAGNALHCVLSGKPINAAHVPSTPRFGSPLNPRGLEAVVVGEWIRASQPVRQGCGGQAQSTVVPGHHQVTRDSL